MAQVTIYIDNNLEEKVKKLAKSAGTSISKFISNILEQKVKTSWDDSVRELSGSWRDDSAFDEEMKSYKTADTKREEL
ncbi:MAG: DUF6364 family protein [Sulfurimonas sp.]